MSKLQSGFEQSVRGSLLAVMAVNPKEIASEVYPTCYFVEAEIAGESDTEVCHWWAEKNAFRHSLSIGSILNYLRTNPASRPLTVLNFSGLYPGHQDFSIVQYFRERAALRYFALDHPKSPFLTAQAFVKKTEELGIHVLLQDLKCVSGEDIRGRMGCPADVILFTEIAEHLEHSTLLRCLEVIEGLLADNGLILFSTPNADSFNHRIAHLMGRELEYWGDGTENLRRSLFGHITYYNIPRLRRLLYDAGLEIQKSSTVNFPVVDPKIKGRKRVLKKTKLASLNALISVGARAWRLPTFMGATKTLGELIYLEVQKASAKKIPFAL